MCREEQFANTLYFAAQLTGTVLRTPYFIPGTNAATWYWRVLYVVLTESVLLRHY